MTSPQNAMRFEELLAQLADTIKRAKTQTGELAETKSKIDEIDRALRGYGGESGLIARVERLHEKINPLVDRDIPNVITSVDKVVVSMVKIETDQNAYRLHYDAEIARLRQDFELHIKSEEKEETKFGGREWFRENGAGILIAVITALTTAISLGVAERLLKAIP